MSSEDPENTRPVGESSDSVMLQMMHAMVKDLCVEFGDDPDEVPCDIWRLHEHMARMRSDNAILASMWDAMGKTARGGFSEEDLRSADQARDRTLYPHRNSLVTPETAERISAQVRADFKEAQREVAQVAAELDAYSEEKARGKR